MTSLSITVDRHPGYCLVSLDGELDRNTERSFSRTVHRLVAGEQARLVVNTGHLAFCDSSGLLALITGQRRAEGAGGALRLIGVHGTPAAGPHPAGGLVPAVHDARAGLPLAPLIAHRQ
jgi:anti-sigma B factor antagonist